MSQTSHSLGYVCRSCRYVLKTSKSPIQSRYNAKRSFTSSNSFLKTLATFTPTSSRELDTLLNTWRNEVFLPSILSPHHQDLIYKTSRRDILTTPPGVSVTVQTALPPSAPNASDAAEETIKLRPMNLSDQTNFTKSFHGITQELYKTPDAQAWDNLIPFLEGLRLARVEPYPHFLPRLARIASSSEIARWNTILTAATMSKRTGLTLAHQALTQELVLGVFQRAVDGGFAHPEPAKTLQRILILLDAPEHCGGKIPQDIKDIKYVDMRRDPTLLAVQSAFAATHALRELSGKDEDGTVVAQMQKLLSIEKANPGRMVSDLQEVGTPVGGKEIWKYNNQLVNLIPLYAALAFTSRVNTQGILGKEKSVQTHVEVQNLLRDVKSRVDEISRKLGKLASQQQTNSKQTLKGRMQGGKDTQSKKQRGLALLEALENSLKNQ